MIRLEWHVTEGITALTCVFCQVKADSMIVQKNYRALSCAVGAGYAGLNLLADVHTDLVKLDMALIRNIDKDKGRRAIARGIIQVCRELSMQVIAEGIETYEELNTLGELGVELFQGYYFARPAFQALAVVPPESYDRRG